MLAKLKTQMWKTFYGLIPKKFYNRMIRELEHRAFYPLDYDKHEILLAQGIRGQTCTNEPEVVKWIETYFKPGQVFYDVRRTRQ